MTLEEIAKARIAQKLRETTRLGSKKELYDENVRVLDTHLKELCLSGHQVCFHTRKPEPPYRWMGVIEGDAALQIFVVTDGRVVVRRMNISMPNWHHDSETYDAEEAIEFIAQWRKEHA